MRTRLLVLIFLLIFTRDLCGQCLTGFEKLLPDPTKNYSENFGSDIAIFDDIMVIGAPHSDSLARIGGIAYLFKKENSEWKRLGVLKPLVPKTALQFGSKIKITANYILIGSGLTNAGVYIYRKPATGWETMTETSLITQPGTTSFGFSFDLSDDQQTLVISDMTYATATGGFYVYHKTPTEEWNGAIGFQYVPNPNKEATDFAFGGVKILNNKIACASNFGLNGKKTIYLYSDNSGGFNNFQLEARLTADASLYFFSNRQFEFTSEGIFTSSSNKILYYKKPASGTWQDSTPTCVFSVDPVDGLALSGAYYLEPLANGDQLYFSLRFNDQSGRIITLKKSGSDWCDGLSQEVIYTEPAPPVNVTSTFGQSMASFNKTEIACSWITSSDNSRPIAIGALTLQANGTWSKQTITKGAFNASKFSLGTALWNTGDYLFASATSERVLERDTRGSVYIFKKQSNAWIKVNKLDQPPSTANDKNFGASIAGHGNYLAIAAPSYKPHGKIFLYKAETNLDWTSPSLIQTIDIPADKYVTTIGDLRMTNDWLVVSVVTNAPQKYVSALLLFYKRDNTEQWKYDQDLDIGSPSFSKGAASIDIEGHTLVASTGYNTAHIIEYNPGTNKWTNKYILTASDPDRDIFFVDPKYGTFYIDGSSFGFSIDINGDKIFIGAPLKNFGSTKDVGAVYVFVRSGTSWASGTETSKLLPVEKTESTIFGYSIKAFNNTLLAGAPRKAKQGSAFIIQSKDYYWKNTIPLFELTGNSFDTDNFGYQVSLDEDDFFISAPLEDNTSGRLAGAVYAIPPPPLLHLEPPVCVSSGSLNLLGYPFNGIWSGAGITDPNRGIFDPASAGPGLHELTYKTENCFYEGKLQIEVKPQPDATALSDINQTICESGRTNVTLQLKPQSDVSYKWLYKGTSDNDFKPNNETNKDILINYRMAGQYKAEISNNSCSVVSPIFHVVVEKLDVQIEFSPEICDAKVISVPLKSNYAGGAWQGDHFPGSYIDQTTQTLNITKLNNGTYGIGYYFVSANKCTYYPKKNIVINRLPQTSIERSGNLCIGGTVSLTTKAIAGVTNHVWLSRSPEGTDTVLPSSGQNSYQITTNGTYTIRLEKGNSCAVILDPIVISDSFEVSLLPQQTALKTCSLVPFYLEGESNPFQDRYEWFYTPDVKEGTKPLLEQSGSKIEIKQTGFYQARIKRAACQYQTPFKFVEYSLPDTLFVPNVFSPNNDGYNDYFRILSTYTFIALKVFNRDGNEVFEGNGLDGWDGTDAPTGVYYWFATLHNCDNQMETKKGYVQLLR